MLPPRNATYWETATSTHIPAHSTIRVSGSSVTSVRNGSPSTCPSIRTDAWSDTGNSGFVIVVGSEKVGIARSTRAWSGPTSSSDGTGGCGIVSAPTDAVEDPGDVGVVDVGPASAVHP